MRILVACEFSGVVRDAFIARGHDAVSCDIVPSESPGPHYLGDVRDILDDDWDMVIGFPPCTYLTRARAHLWGRDWQKEVEAYRFFMTLWNAPAGRICLENPIGMLNKIFCPPNQYVEPYEYGHPFTKRTGLWLKNLPLLVPTNVVDVPRTRPPTRHGCAARGSYVYTQNGKNKKYRSRSFEGIAAAMADQWGHLA